MKIDIGNTLDATSYGGLQQQVLLLAALSIMMDGFDGQLIGYAIPVLLKEWSITREAFSPTVAAGLIGMGIGSACAGFFADRFGRRWALIGSVLLFGITTCAIGLSNNLVTLTLLRFVTGLGVGGALPSATTLTAEFTPARHRTLAVTATIVCVPLGGMLAGFFASMILPVYGWRMMFFIGGALSLLLSGLLICTLPESPRFLMRYTRRWPELIHLLRRMGHPVSANALFSDQEDQQRAKHVGFRALFEQGRTRDTLSIWCAFFMCLLTIYAAFSWLPTMLSNEGLNFSVASAGLTAYNLGGVFGALGCAWLVSHFGSRLPLLFCCAGGAISAFLLLRIDIPNHTGLLIFGLGIHGLFTNAVQSVMYALCAYVYPTQVRATGTAMALVWGRSGTIISAFAGAAVITAGGAAGYLSLLGVAMVLVFLALMVTRGHIPSRKTPVLHERIAAK